MEGIVGIGIFVLIGIIGLPIFIKIFVKSQGKFGSDGC